MLFRSTSKYKRFVDLESLEKSVESSKTHLPFVWKCAQFGYDGNGVKIVRSTMDLLHLPDVECIAEEMIDFKNELAVIVARNVSGEIKTYPVVEMEFHPEANQVEYVICPARIDYKVAEKAQEIALKVSEKFNHVGLLAVELFRLSTSSRNERNILASNRSMASNRFSIHKELNSLMI